MKAQKNQGRAWNFISAKPLPPEKEQAISEEITEFLSGWKAHGASLSSGFEIRNHQILFIWADEGKASATGCSIDSMRKTVENILNNYGVQQCSAWEIPFLDTEETLHLLDMRLWREAKTYASLTHVYPKHLSDAGAYSASGWEAIKVAQWLT